MPKVSFFEMSVDDPKRAMNFYDKVFGWKFQKWEDQEYWLITAGDKKEGGINGAVQPKKPESQPVVNTINVPNIDETIKKIEKNGGKIVAQKMDIPKVGTLAYFVDTEGNMSGILQPLPSMQM